MLLTLVFVIAELISIDCYTVRDESTRSSVFSTSDDYVLYGHGITSQQTYDILSCVHTYLANARCKSFNFENIPNGMCELSSEDTRGLGDTSLFLFRQGFIYGEIQNLSTPVISSNEHIPVAEYTFTALGASGNTGPTSTSGYAGTSLENMVRLDSGIQLWTVPKSGNYVIEAYGASGANGTCTSPRCGIGDWKLGGLGAKITGTFELTKSEELKILVGQEGQRPTNAGTRSGGGGGGTFVVLSNETKPIIIAGGGGGGGQSLDSFHDGDPGQAMSNGSQCGGSNGSGGRLCSGNLKDAFAATGAGFMKDGIVGMLMIASAKSFINGGQGGEARLTDGKGGFGGGGHGMVNPGGGGGYSGGGLSDTKNGTAGGGGSYNAGTSQINESGISKGGGQVVIKLF